MYRVCCLFIRNDSETTETQGHSNTTQLHHPPSLPRSRSTNTHNERRRAREPIDQKSRRCANEENVHQTEMLEDPLIVVRGKELVAPDPTACDHHPAAWSGPAPADRNRTAGEAVAPSSSSACSTMDTMGVDCHPCASKQVVQNVRFARREQGLGRADRRGKKSSW